MGVKNNLRYSICLIDLDSSFSIPFSSLNSRSWACLSWCLMYDGGVINIFSYNSTLIVFCSLLIWQDNKLLQNILGKITRQAVSELAPVSDLLISEKPSDVHSHLPCRSPHFLSGYFFPPSKISSISLQCHHFYKLYQ